MAKFIGFNTQNYDTVRAPRVSPGADGGAGSFATPTVFGKKFTGYDEQMVIQDFINALNIPQGSKTGNPGYGTTLWSFIFEPNDVSMQVELENEIRRIGSLDPRLALNTIQIYPQDSGVLLEVEFAVVPFNNVQTLEILFDQASGTAAAR